MIQCPLHLLQEGRCGKGFLQMAGCGCLLHELAGGRLSRDHNDRQRLAAQGQDPTDKVGEVQIGQVEIEQDQVGRTRAQQLKPMLGAYRLLHAQAQGLQVGTDQFS